MKQEQRDEQDVGAAPSMPPPRPLPPPPSQPNLHLLRTQLPPPDSGQSHDGLLAPRGLVPCLPHPQPAYSPASSSSYQPLPGLHGHGLSMDSDYQLMSPPPAFHPAPAPAPPPAPPARPSYPPMQHNLAYNGQPGLPMSAGSPRAYERPPYHPDPSASCPHLGLGAPYGPPGSAPPSAAGQSLHPHPPPRLHSMGYRLPPVPRVSSPTRPMAPPPLQLQHALGYHSAPQRSASCPSPATSPLPSGPSPCSGPSSPQLHSLPYRSPTGSSPSPSPAPSSPLMRQPSPQASLSPLGHPLAPPAPFAPEGERQDIKQEPQDKEPTFRSIGLQDITLDDGKALRRGARGRWRRSSNALCYSIYF